MSRRPTEFQTIRSEGGLLPPDLLRRVVDPAGKVSGVEPTAYRLPAGERLNEAITQSWNRLRRHWSEFRAASKDLPEGDATTGLTNDKWSLPLLRELGFGFLTTTAGPTIDGKTYAISRFSGNAAIHLVGCGVSLDHRAAGVRGAAVGNPHGLVQEFLNRSPGHLWAIVSNGISFRILRDNQALSRQSFLEFDLEAMFDGEVYSDFVLLWLIAHATRFLPRADGRPDSCWLETWSKEAAEQGVAALTDLRGGVEKALEILGQGFVSHPNNTALRDALRKGDVKLSDFHGQLLRIVYRLIFLFVAEDRELEGISLLHPQDKSDKARLARERYAAHYSTSRLRELASRIKGSRHGDLWRQFQLLVGALSGEDRFAAMRAVLALPPLGSMLWNPASTALLNGPGLSDPGTELSNVDFLEALRHLAFIRKDKILRPVDYKNLGSEEFGGVYESFLALTPQISGDGARFTFAEFAGNERKTSGSYYTPDSLVQCLLDSALDPVVNERLADAERLAKADWPAVEKEIQSDPAKRTYVLAFLTKHAGASKTATAEERKRAWDSAPPTLRRWKLSEEAILAIKVCDKACGSGHFLVGAGHRLARHLARVRALAQGESEPSPLLYQTALRDVIGHCLYGVDINPMAVELCKVTLWLEAMEPGKPLSFLDHHIRCGNSLLGATPELIKGGIPDEAYEAIEGDDKEACAALKKQNKRENPKLGDWFIADEAVLRDKLFQAAAAIDEMGDSRPEDIQRKESAFQNAQQNYDFQKAWDLANLWCAAFVIKKRFPDSSPAGAGEDAQRPGEGRRNAPATLDDKPLATQGGLFGGTEELPKAKAKKTKAPSLASSETPIGITTQHLRAFVEGGALPDGLLAESKRLADEYQFFHWHLVFPEVFAQGGFDVSLGNPPWETLSPDAKEFFSAYAPDVRNQDKDAQDVIISRLLENPIIALNWETSRRAIFAAVHFIKSSGLYRLFAAGNLGKGDFNLFRMFIEGALSSTRKGGHASQIVPEGLYNGANSSALRAALFTTCRLDCVLGFENARETWFDGIDTRMKFCLYAARMGGETDSFKASFNIRSLEHLQQARRGDGLVVPVSMVREFSPDALAIMEFANQRDIEIAIKMYSRWPKFGDETSGPPRRIYMRELDMGNDREVFGNEPGGVPLYEGRMVDQFDHRAKGYRSGRGRTAVWQELAFGTVGRSIQPQWRLVLSDVPDKVRDRMDRYRVGFCDVASPTNERTLIAALLPPGVVAGDKVPTLLFEDGWDWACMVWLAVANSFTMDFIARKKVALKMSYTVLDSLPFPRLSKDDALARQIVPLVLRLTCCGPEMTAYWNLRAAEGWVEAVPAGGQAPGTEDEAERLAMRAELDAIVARDLFGLTPAEMGHILATFSTWQEREMKRYGEFRTRRLILENYDRSAEATSAEQPRFDRERIQFKEPGDYILSLVGALLRHKGGECDLMILIRAYAMLLGDRQTFSTLAEARFGAEAGAWVKRFNQPVDAAWFLPVIRGLDNRDKLKLEERGETDVFVRLLDASLPSNATVETDVYLLMQVLDLNAVPPAAVAEQVRRIAHKSVRASLHEATAIMA